jgi:hypothetical protein
MHKIGQTAAGNQVVELTPAEYKELERVLQAKAAGPVASAMSLPELVDYVVPRLRKLRPNTKEKVFHSVGAMFQFTGGVEPAVLEKLFGEMKKRGAIQDKAGAITYPAA